MIKRNIVAAAAFFILATGLGVFSTNIFLSLKRIPAGEAKLQLGQETIAPNEEADFTDFMMRINSVQMKNAKETGGGVVHRGFHAKTHACVRGELRISSDAEINAGLARANQLLQAQKSMIKRMTSIFASVPDSALTDIGVTSVQAFRSGVFSEGEKSFPLWVRYSNASGAIQSDEKSDARGMAVKVMSVPGKKFLKDRESDTTQDFLMTNKPRGTTDDARSFMEFAEATSPGGNLPEFFLKHPELNKFKEIVIITKVSKQKGDSLLNKQYWSGVPILLGERAIKFNVTPCKKLPENKNLEKSESRFKQDLTAQLTQADVCFDFNIQFQVDPVKTPIEHALTEWKESDTPSIKVGQIVLKKLSEGQELSSDDHACEGLAFNPWHALLEHRPLGNMNRARLYVYKASQAGRHADPAEPSGY